MTANDVLMTGYLYIGTLSKFLKKHGCKKFDDGIPNGTYKIYEHFRHAGLVDEHNHPLEKSIEHGWLKYYASDVTRHSMTSVVTPKLFAYMLDKYCGEHLDVKAIAECQKDSAQAFPEDMYTAKRHYERSIM